MFPKLRLRAPRGTLGCVKFAARLRTFESDRRGAVALMLGLALLPMALLLGGAVDYHSAINARTLSQAALDSGVLAAAAQNTSDTTVLKKFYNAHITSRNLTLTGATLTISTDAATGATVYVADAHYTVKTSFLGVMGLRNWTGHTHAEAYTPTQIVTMTVKPTNAQGAWSKDIFVFTRDASGTIASSQTIMTYRYTYPSTKVTTPSVGTWSGSYSIPKYSTLGVGLVVYQDMNYLGALVSPATKYSDATDASTWIHTSGACADSGGQTVNMEDGGDSNYLDFVYTVTCTTGPAPGSVVRLKS
jgi:Flp pilus assembly protein TadG